MKLKKVHLLILFLIIFIFIIILINSIKSKDFTSLLRKVNNTNAANVNINMTKYMYNYDSNNLGISRAVPLLNFTA
jgi:flagellar biosynthesis/type III secretory pathway M-ring protein FliF/YscJ